jgi:4-oxalocrotonate tautomerase
MQPDRTRKGVNIIRSHIVLQGTIMPVVILKMRKGWTTEQKRRIVKEFTNTLVSTLKIDPDLVTIMIDEHSLEDIGHGGVLRCDEH